MPSGGPGFRESRKHRMHLKLVERMMNDHVPGALTKLRRMRDAFQLLRSYPTIGDFLAYQLVTDINYSQITDYSEMEFTVPGPGARDGIRKCFASLGGLTEADLIRFVTEQQAEEFSRLDLDFASLWGRPLQYIDCQNLFCEVDKYARIHHPDVPGLSGRTRIKQQFRSSHEPIPFWYPPKWHINEEISRQTRGLVESSAQ